MKRKLIQFAEDQKKKKTGAGLKIAGGAAMLLGASAMPAAIPMQRAAARRAVANYMPKTAKRRGYGAAGGVKRMSAYEKAAFKADYIRSAQRLKRTPHGAALSALSGRMMRNAKTGKNLVGRRVRQGEANDIHYYGAHNRRFMENPKSAHKHWDWEVSNDMKNTIRDSPGKNNTPSTNKKYRMRVSGMRQYQRRVDGLVNRGKNYQGALDGVAKQARRGSLSEAEQSYLTRNVLNKEGAYKSYTKQALIPPALMAAGGGAYYAGSKRDRNKKKQTHFSIPEYIDPNTQKGDKIMKRLMGVGIGMGILSSYLSVRNSRLIGKKLKLARNKTNRHNFASYTDKRDWDGVTGINPKTRKYEDNRSTFRKMLPKVIGAGAVAGLGLAALNRMRPKVGYPGGWHWGAGTIFEPSAARTAREAAVEAAARENAKNKMKRTADIRDQVNKERREAKALAKAKEKASSSKGSIAKKQVSAPRFINTTEPKGKTAPSVKGEKSSSGTKVGVPPQRRPRPIPVGGVQSTPSLAVNESSPSNANLTGVKKKAVKKKAVKKKAAVKKPKQGELDLSARLSRMVEFNYSNLRNPKENNKFAGSLAPQAAYRKAQTTRRWAGRAAGVGKDLDDMISRRPRDPKRKRFYEKSWFRNGIATIAIASPLYASRQLANAHKRWKPLDRFKWGRKINDNHQSGIPMFSAKQNAVNLSSYLDSDDTRNAGWDVRDARGRSARVFTPGSRPRNRRKKKKGERVENIRRTRNIAIGAAALGVGGSAYLGVSRASVPVAMRSKMRKSFRRGRLSVARWQKSQSQKKKPQSHDDQVVLFPKQKQG